MTYGNRRSPAAPQVHLARSRATGAAVALKHMSLPQRGVLPLRVEREVAALNTVRHPNVVELVDVCRQASAAPARRLRPPPETAASPDLPAPALTSALFPSPPRRTTTCAWCYSTA